MEDMDAVSWEINEIMRELALLRQKAFHHEEEQEQQQQQQQRNDYDVGDFFIFPEEEGEHEIQNVVVIGDSSSASTVSSPTVASSNQEPRDYHPRQPKQQNYRHEVRRCLRRLDHNVNIVVDAIRKEIKAAVEERIAEQKLMLLLDQVEEDSSSYTNHQYHHQNHGTQNYETLTPVYPVQLPDTVRKVFFDILTEIDLDALGVCDDGNVHKLYQNICRSTSSCLVQSALPFTNDQPYPAEAAALWNRISEVLVQRPDESLFLLSTPEEMDCLSILLTFLNVALGKASRDENSNKSTDESDSAGSEDEIESSSPKMETKMEKLFGDSIYVLDFLHAILPAACKALERTSTWESFDRNPNQDIHQQLWGFVDHLFQHMTDSISFVDQGNCSLREWLMEQALINLKDAKASSRTNDTDEVHDLNEIQVPTDKTLEMLQAYITKFLEFTFDVIDSSVCAIQSHMNSDAANTTNVDFIQDTNYYAGVAHRALTLIRGTPCRSDVEVSGGTSTTSLWIAYTKFFLAARTAGMDENDYSMVTNVLVKLGTLALAENETNEPAHRGGALQIDATSTVGGRVLDREIEHAISLTFLSAVESPDLLIQNYDFLTSMEKLARISSELRHLVQGVALKELVMPMSGTARDPSAMQSIVQKLVTIGIATSTDAHPSRADPWDQFFRDQIEKLHANGKNEPCEACDEQEENL